jgi:hypothetical protein
MDAQVTRNQPAVIRAFPPILPLGPRYPHDRAGMIYFGDVEKNQWLRGFAFDV